MNKAQLLAIYSKYRIIIFPVLVSISCIVLIVLIIYPQTNDFFKSKEQLQTLEQKKITLDAKAKVLAEINEIDINKKLQSVLTALPPEKDFTGAIGLIQRLCSEEGVSLTTFQLGQAVAGSGGSAAYNINIDVLAPKEMLDRLLKKIESSDRVMKLSGIEIASYKNDQAVTASLSIDIFYSELPKTIGGVEADLPKLTAEDEQLLATLAKVSNTPFTNAGQISSVPKGKANPFE